MDLVPPPESSDPRSRQSKILSALSALTFALLIILAAGGAAAHPEGVLVGLPSLSFLGLAVLGTALIWTSGLRGLGGFLLPASAVLLGAILPNAFSSLLLFTGRPLFTFVLAGLFLGVATLGRRPPRALMVPILICVYAAVAFETQTRVGPDGDEPQYLMVAESLLRDHDLVLDQDFKEERYRTFFSRPLEPHFRIRGPEGQIYSLHAVGLSILVLPAYALFGYAGASFFMAVLAALLVRDIRRLVRNVTGEPGLAEGTAWLVGLCPPIIHFAGLIFTEIPAALLLCVGLRTAAFGHTASALRAAALCAAALPWLNVRYAILSVAIAGAIALRHWLDRRSRTAPSAAGRDLLPPALILIASALAISIYHFKLWGFFDPRRVYGRRREFSLDVFPEGFPGLFLDQEFGLFVYAPIFVLSFSGVVQLWRRQRVLALFSILAFCGVVATASVWPMWRGGFNPPARFLVPLVSILAVSLSLSLQRRLGTSAALLAGWSLWCGVGGAFNMETIHRDRDGVAPFFRTQSGAREWTGVLPSFVLPEDRPTRVLAWPWAALLGSVLLMSARRRQPSPHGIRNRDTLVASALFMAVAAIADRVSPRSRSLERDATRLTGSTVVLLPSFGVHSGTEAVWPIDIFYEPHRAPAGHMFAEAMRLESALYDLELSSAEFVGVNDSATLSVRHRSTGRSIEAPLNRAGEGLLATFLIEPGGDYDLSLRGGQPMFLKRVRLVRRPTK